MENDNISIVNGTYSYSRTDKIRILTIVIEQMKAMVTENEKEIALEHDVENRTNLLRILNDEIRKNQLKIDKLMRGEQLAVHHFQRTGSDEADV